jgi:hypothetical protein
MTDSNVAKFDRDAVTNEDIRELLAEAASHGDDEQVELCRRALEDGDSEAADACIDVLERAWGERN